MILLKISLSEDPLPHDALEGSIFTNTTTFIWLSAACFGGGGGGNACLDGLGQNLIESFSRVKTLARMISISSSCILTCRTVNKENYFFPRIDCLALLGKGGCTESDKFSEEFQ